MTEVLRLPDRGPVQTGPERPHVRVVLDVPTVDFAAAERLSTLVSAVLQGFNLPEETLSWVVQVIGKTPVAVRAPRDPS